MAAQQAAAVHAPAPPSVRLSLALTGHRVDNPGYAANEATIAKVLAAIFDGIDAAVAAEPPLLGLGPVAPTRLHNLFADGADQLGVRPGAEARLGTGGPPPLRPRAQPRDQRQARRRRRGARHLGWSR